MGLNSKSGKLVAPLLGWFAANARDLPWRRTRDPYAIWVSEIMLQQTQVEKVLSYWERWMRELPTIEAAAAASSERIHKLWEGLGYYARARNLQRAAQAILERHEGRFPKHFDDVLALPGIGRYTAGAICSIAFNQPAPILDGNVIRVLTRIFGIKGNPRGNETNTLLWRIAEKLVSRAKDAEGEISSRPSRPSRGNNSCSCFNQSLMELGALICTPRNPTCKICPVKKLCVAFRENRVGEFPNPGRHQPALARRFVAFVLESNGKFLVRQRPAGMVNAHLWEFPNAELGARLSGPQHTGSPCVNGKIPAAHTVRARWEAGDPRSEWLVDAARQALGFTPNRLEPLCIVKHSITRHRITLEAFRVRMGKVPARAAGVWLSPGQLDALAFAGAHRRILKQFQEH